MVEAQKRLKNNYRRAKIVKVGENESKVVKNAQNV